MKKFIIVFFSFFSIYAFADTNQIIKNLAPFVGTVQAENVLPTEIKGVYEVITLDPIESIYVSENGRYIFRGDIIDLSERTIKEKSSRIKKLIKNELDTIKDEDMIIFKSENEKHEIIVFTDVDCPFCARLHAQVPDLNKFGVTVKYAASPLEQLHPTALAQMEKIWCAEDRVQAMDDYKTLRIVPKSQSCDNPVREQIAIAKKLGVNGTPTIFFEDGTSISGFVPANELIRILEQ